MSKIIINWIEIEESVLVEATKKAWYTVEKNKGGKYPEIWTTYFSLSDLNAIEIGSFSWYKVDLYLFHSGNFYYTEQEAQAQQAKNNALYEIRKWCFDNGVEIGKAWEADYYLYRDEYGCQNTRGSKDFRTANYLKIFKSKIDGDKVIANCLPQLKVLFDVK